jgi:hypothetical protein
MEAARLIEATSAALAQCATLPGVVAEAWQAQALVEAVGSHLVLSGPQSARGEALGLRDAGARACRALHVPGRCTGGIRAARLTTLHDPRAALARLSELLGEVGAALVGAAVTAEEAALYWQCVEAIDAADESGDRVAAVLRRLSVPEPGGVG